MSAHRLPTLPFFAAQGGEDLFWIIVFFTESLNLKLIRSVKVCIRMCSKNHEWWYKRHFGGLVSFVAILWELSWDSEKCFALDLGFLMFISSFGDDLEFILHTFNKGSQYFIPHPQSVRFGPKITILWEKWRKAEKLTCAWPLTAMATSNSRVARDPHHILCEDIVLS